MPETTGELTKNTAKERGHWGCHSDVDVARLNWAAGLVDGEGCICVVWLKNRNGVPRKNPTPRLKLIVAQSDYGALHYLKNVIGVHGTIQKNTPHPTHNRQAYSLCFDGRHALQAIRLLEPLLYVKRRQAQVAIEFWEQGRLDERPGGRGFPDEVWATRRRLARRLSRMK